MTAFNNPDKEVIKEAQIIVTEALVASIDRVADAIYDLGTEEATSAGEAATMLALANECAGIGNSIDDIMAASELNTMQKFQKIRELLAMIREHQARYLAEHELLILQATEEANADDGEDDQRDN